MAPAEGLVQFWSSLISEKGLIPHVEKLMGIEDHEERAISLISRVVFLWSMGMKYKREESKELLQNMNSILNNSKNICKNCSELKKLIKESSVFKTKENNAESSSLHSKANEQNYSKCIKQDPINILKDNENINMLKKQSPKKILAPETEKLSQSKVRKQDNENIIVPETLHVNESAYGNTDFFEDSEDIWLKSDSQELFKGSTSPVLGKQNKVTHTPMSSKDRRQSAFKENIYKASALSESPNEIKYISNQSIDSPCNSPSLLGCEPLLPAHSERGDCVPVLDVKKNSDSLIDVEMILCSPKKRGKASNSKESQYLDLNTSGSQTTSTDKKKKSPSCYKSKTRESPRKTLAKAKSDMSVTVPKFKGISQIKTLGKWKVSKPDFIIEIDQYKKCENKNYRQTKITENCFIKKSDATKLTEGSVGEKEKLEQERKLLAEVLEESIRTSKVEKMMRNKCKEMEQNRPIKLRKLSPSKKRSIGSPAKKTDQQCAVPSPNRALRKGIRMKEDKTETSLGEHSKNTHITEDELLAQLCEEEKDVDVVKVKPKTKRKRLFEDSFDVPPSKRSEPADFAYKEDVVRKKSDRKRLEGGDCLECRDYFNARGLTDSERKEVKNTCSRHRSKFSTVTNTPEGFWQVGWGDED